MQVEAVALQGVIVHFGPAHLPSTQNLLRFIEKTILHGFQTALHKI